MRSAIPEASNEESTPRGQAKSTSNLNFSRDIESVQSIPKVEPKKPRIPQPVKNDNIFLKQTRLPLNKHMNPFFCNFVQMENMRVKIDFKNRGQNQDFTDDVQYDVDVLKKKSKGRKKTLLISWQRNTLLYPPDFNAEFDVMDRNQELRNFAQINEDMERLEKEDEEAALSQDRGDLTGARSQIVQSRLPQSAISLSPAINHQPVNLHGNVSPSGSARGERAQ